MYYGLIALSVLMFGGCFALQDAYRKMRGSSLRISLEASFIGSVAGAVVLLVSSGFKIEFTPFTLLVALLAALNGIAFNFCSFKALDTINLSLFSLFSMLGGMLLPFVQGIVFYSEPFTLAKALCFVLIGAALCLTVVRGEKSKGWLYYALIFILNGMSGVLSKIFASASFEKTGSVGYSLWVSVCTVMVSGIALLFVKEQETTAPYSLKALGNCTAQGAINRIANLLLVISLANVDASVQYPMVTGGVMIVSTLLCFFGTRKPSGKELLSIALAFLGTLALFVVPI